MKRIISFWLALSIMLISVNVIAEEEHTYLEGNPEYENLKIYEAEEKEGGFFIEAEDGTLRLPMEICEDDTASGGRYIAAPGTTSVLSSPLSTELIFARYKFKISQKGKYRVWVRFFTPEALYKSTWFSFDEEEYTRIDWPTTLDWVWYGSEETLSTPGVGIPTQYFDEGWHTLNIKYRQAGQRIDCIIITPDTDFSPTGLGSLPGEEIRPSVPTREEREKIKISVNGTQVRLDFQPEIKESTIMVPAANVIGRLGIKLEDRGDYFIAVRGRNYIKFSLGDNTAVMNGRQVKLTQAPYLYEDTRMPFLPIELITDFFDGEYEFDETSKTLTVTADIRENYRAAEEGEIIVEPGMQEVFYKIPYENPDARVQVFVRNHNYVTDRGYFSAEGYDYWYESYPPVYKDGAFCGHIGSLQERQYFDVKVRIIDNEKEDIFIAENLFQTTWTQERTIQECAYKTGGELLLVPTFENIGYYIDVDSAEYECEIYYRKNGEEWKKAFEPYFDKYNNQFRGSIVGLEENTEYEVKAEISGKRKYTKTALVKMWTDEPPIAETIPISELYKGGTLTVGGLHGTEEGWLKIVGDGSTVIDGGRNSMEAVYIYDCSYVIFENLTVRGGERYGIHVTGNSDNIRIVNCDISNWGRRGAFDSTKGLYFSDGDSVDYDAGVRVVDVSNVVIERCYFHDSNATTNAWYGPTWDTVHPLGATAVLCRSRTGLVIRYNDFIGGDDCRWNDAVEAIYNGDRKSGVGPDSDIYGNMLIFGQDDGIELDGAGQNVRFYQNRVENFRCGISCAPVLTGPNYIFRNVVTNLGDSNNNHRGCAVKIAGSVDNIYGYTYFFHNTMDVADEEGIDNVGYQTSEFHGMTRNNILVSGNGSFAFRNPYAIEGWDNNDYNLISGQYKGLDSDQKHGIFAKPIYNEDKSLGIAAESPGIDAGEVIDNFNEGFVTDGKPDMGAFEEGQDRYFMPYRPVDMKASTYCISFKDSMEEEITVTLGEIESGLDYRIIKNECFDWFDIEAEQAEGKAESGAVIKFKLKAYPEKIRYANGNGAVLFRLSNGYSIPISVYCLMQLQ